ncbi:MAG TPA: asparagine synthase (glutamine-hydrolyzing), partial [Sphingobium sp.]|nr:asparagine synthase (glutamine-hydrolyzing) [Sphingobium sp.]
MCGIAGVLTSGAASHDAVQRDLERMISSIRHRGPDDAGFWVDGGAGIGLGQARLSIVDLSPMGHQPMLTDDGRLVITFNGEIYNHRDIRKELPGTNWRGGSDTETFLAAIRAWGLHEALNRAVGMFAFALWDRDRGVLSLARDRMGEKPLYYGWNKGSFLFGSELKALRAHPAFQAGVNRDALAYYVRTGYVGGADCIYQGIAKVPPGSYLEVSIEDRTPKETSYWSVARAVDAARRRPFEGDAADAVRELEQLLAASVRGQMLADVPLGAFLSGGVDSSTIVSLMQCASTVPVKTFTIGFNEAGFDEAAHARLVASHLGTDHTELHLSANDALGVVPSLPAIYDEPFADSSQMPTILVSRLARRHVTVALSGDGGDELFCGYSRYRHVEEKWGKLSRAPGAMRGLLGNVLPRSALTDGLAARSLDEFYRFSNTQWKGYGGIV